MSRADASAPHESRDARGGTRLLSALTLAAAAAAGLRPISSPDAFWHLASGRWMLDNAEIPRVDPFRLAPRGAGEPVPWVDHEWGFQLLLGLAERVGGLAGVVALRSALLVVVVWILWRLGGRVEGRDPDTADRTTAHRGLLLLATLVGLTARLPLRPELLTLVAFALLLWLLERWGDTPRTLAPWLVVLVAVWANVHPGVLAAPVVVGLFYLGRKVAQGPESADQRWGPALALPGLAFAAIALNPWGFEVVLLPLRIRAALADLPASNPDWKPLWADPPWLLLAALTLLVLWTVLAARRRRVLDLPALFVLAGVTALTVQSVRFQGLCWIAAYWYACRMLADCAVGEDTAQLRSCLRPLAATAAALVAAVLVAASFALPFVLGTVRPLGVEPDRFPAGGVATLAAWDAERGGVGPLFNSAVFGGYVLAELHPPRRVFLDTRNEVDPQRLRRLATARSDAREWQALVADFGFDAALVRYEDRPRQVLGPPRTPGGSPTVEVRTTSALLFPPSRWALVHWDDVAMLFLRRTDERAGDLARFEYAHVQPEDVAWTLDRAAHDSAFRRGLAADLERKLKDDPDSERARRLLEMVESLPAPDTERTSDSP